MLGIKHSRKIDLVIYRSGTNRGTISEAYKSLLRPRTRSCFCMYRPLHCIALTAQSVKNNCAPGEEKNSIFNLQICFQKSSRKILIYYFRLQKYNKYLTTYLLCQTKKKGGGGGETANIKGFQRIMRQYWSLFSII